MLEQELRKIGLSDKEAKVYLAALELGKAPVQDIAQKAGINRTTTYVMIESLIEKGLMAFFDDKHKKYYNAESPDNIEKIFKKREQELKKEQEDVSKLVPQLKAIFNKGDIKPKIRYYEGNSGIEEIFEQMINDPTKSLRCFVNIDDIINTFKDKKDYYITKLIKNRFKLRVLYAYKKGEINKQDLPEFFKEAKNFKIKEYSIEANFIITDKMVYILLLNNSISGVVIENKDFASSINAFFESCWTIS